MITFQENTHFSQALPCKREEFWEQVRKATTAWRVDARRAILAAVDASKTQGVAALQTWLNNAEYQKFLLKKQNLKREKVREAFFKKNDAERLLAFAQDVKENLPAFIFSCREFDATETAKGGKFCHRRLADCHLNGLVMLDIDHVENPMQIWYQLRAKKELLDRTGLVHITSSKEGIRIVFTADINVGNLADNQIEFAQALGDYKADDSCIDATRNSFAPKEEDILYINEELLFNYYDEEFDKRFTPDYRNKKTQPIHHSFDDHGAVRSSANVKTPVVASENAEQGAGDERQMDAEKSLKWRGYDLQSIIDARYGEKLPCRDDSNRHTESLKLATDLLLMLDGDKERVQSIVERQTWVQEIIDERGEDVAQTVESAASCVAEKEKKYASSLPSKSMLVAVKAATGRTYQEVLKGDKETGRQGVQDNTSDITQMLDIWGAEIEGMFDDYPILRDICKGLKRNQYTAALFVAGGLMMTLMTRCTYRFYHRRSELRRLNNSTLIIGDPASGKSFATRLYKLLAKPIVEADKVGKDAINAYREQMRSKGANKDKPKKPKVIVRIHPARTSNAQFIQDMVNSVENVDGVDMQLHMLTFDTELDNTLSLQKGGAYIDKQSLQLKAFHNEEDGQAYSNNDSILQDFIVVWNFIFTGTPLALKRMVNEQNFGSGLATRLTCIPLPATDFKMMDEDEEEVDEESDSRLTEWAAKLDRMKGELTVKQIVHELYEWTARRMADAAENESRADEMLLKRCAYHGLNFSAPFIVMRHWDKMHQEGNYWCGEFETDEVDWKLAELIVNIQYACQRHYFGAMAEAYFDNKLKDASVNVRHQQKTLESFSRLPEEFTVEDLMKCFGVSHNAATTRICRLSKDHLVEKIGEYKENGASKCKYRKTGVILL
jgi:hypothetical protein